MVELWNFLSFWGISIYIRVGRPTQGRRGKLMSAMEYFLLGVMVSWTPSLIVLAWLVRPALNLDA